MDFEKIMPPVDGFGIALLCTGPQIYIHYLHDCDCVYYFTPEDPLRHSWSNLFFLRQGQKKNAQHPRAQGQTRGSGIFVKGAGL